jgi:hypothetical protein
MKVKGSDGVKTNTIASTIVTPKRTSRLFQFEGM